MWQRLPSGNECVLEGIVHKIVQRGGVEVGEGGQPTAKVGGALLRTKHATKSQIVRLLEVLST